MYTLHGVGVSGVGVSGGGVSLPYLTVEMQNDISEQDDDPSYILHGAYSSKDRDSRTPHTYCTVRTPPRTGTAGQKQGRRMRTRCRPL